MQGPTIKQFGAFKVTDDGVSKHRYGVWASIVDGEDLFIAGGANLNNAKMVAEALQKTSAGNNNSTLVEGKRFER